MGEKAGDYGYELRLRINSAVRYLREAEDMARIERPNWPTADRIRSIYEQITADVLNGRVSVPPLQQQIDALVAALADPNSGERQAP